jgi:hypothetical protein
LNPLSENGAVLSLICGAQRRRDETDTVQPDLTGGEGFAVVGSR